MGDDLRLDIRRTKETLHQLPNKGFGYAQLMGMDVSEEPLMGFNYLGEVDAEQHDDSLFKISDVDSGYDIAPENTFGTAISLNCSVANGQLSCRFTYDEALFCSDELSQLANGMIQELEANSQRYRQYYHDRRRILRSRKTLPRASCQNAAHLSADTDAGRYAP